jgi:hypothetical protein
MASTVEKLDNVQTILRVLKNPANLPVAIAAQVAGPLLEGLLSKSGTCRSSSGVGGLGVYMDGVCVPVRNRGPKALAKESGDMSFLSSLSKAASTVSRVLPKVTQAAQAVDAVRALKGKAPKYSTYAGVAEGIFSPNTGESAAAGQGTPVMHQKRMQGKRIGGAAPKRRKSVARSVATARKKMKRKPKDYADYLAETDEMESYASWKKSKKGKRKTKAKKAKGTRKFSPKQIAAQKAFAARNRGRKGKVKKGG